MSNRNQTTKNIELTQKFIEYLIQSKNVPELPQNVSFVAFSNIDTRLNKANQELLEIISKEDNPVARVEEPNDKTGSWKITPVNF